MAKSYVEEHLLVKFRLLFECLVEECEGVWKKKCEGVYLKQHCYWWNTCWGEQIFAHKILAQTTYLQPVSELKPISYETYFIFHRNAYKPISYRQLFTANPVFFYNHWQRVLNG